MSSPPEATPLVQVDFSMKVGTGRLEASAVVPSGVTTLPVLLPVLQQLCDNVIDATTSQVREEGFVVSCQEGCTACCHQIIPVSLFEAEALANWVRSLPQDQQAILASRFDAAVAALRGAGLLERLQPSQKPANRAEEYQLGLDYLQARVACPFLLNGCCGIRPMRPLTCREYMVTSPAEFCWSPTPETVRPVPVPMKLSLALMTIASPLTEDRTGWIPLVLLFEWMREGKTVGSALEKPGPELLRHVVEQVVSRKAEVPPASS